LKFLSATNPSRPSTWFVARCRNMTNRRPLRSRYLEGFAAAFLLLSTLFVFGPESAFRTNPVEIAISLTRLLALGTLVAVAGALLLACLGLLLRGRSFRVTLAIVVATAFMFYIQTNFFLWDYGAFDGTDLDYAAFDPHGWFEIGAWTAGFLLAWSRADWISRKLVPLVGFLLIAQLGGMLVGSLTHDGLWESPPHWDRDPELFEFSDETNVVVILLDGFTGSTFNRALGGLDNPPDFDGFTYFRDSVSAFNWTHMSVPAILSGGIYNNTQTVPVFMTEELGNRSVPETLARRGFTSHVWTDPYYCPFFEKTRCVSNAPYDEFGLMLSFMDFALFRALPHYVKKPLRLERGVFQAWGSEKGWMIPEQRHSLRLIKDFERNARATSSAPTFKMLHLFLPHGPWVLDSQCERLPPQLIQTVTGYMNQASCGLKVTGDLLATLERIGVYDSSLVIIVSDHGSWAEFPDESSFANKSRRARALTLIKPPNSRGPLQSLSTSVSVSDVPTTIASVLALELVAPYEGRSAFEPNEARDRSRRYYEHLGEEPPFLSPIQEFIIQGSVYSSSAWTKGRLIEAPP